MRRARESQDWRQLPTREFITIALSLHPRVELIWLAGLIPGVGLSD